MKRLRFFKWRPLPTILFIIGIALIGVLLYLSFTPTETKPTTEVRIGSGSYSLWLADTEAELIQGLSGTNKLAENGGLLMKFDSDDIHSIWMKDMNYPLDLVWLNSDGEVVYIVENAPAEDPAETIYTPNTAARYVLELPAGSIKKSTIQIGDTATLTLDV